MATEQPLGEFEHLVLLAILRLDRDAYGVSIARALQELAGRHVSRGALYVTLDRLEAKGLIRWKISPGGKERGDLPRRCYTVTAHGVAVLRATREVLRRMWRGVEDVLKES
jgi:PadR family transcriptional regulator, regulatory protein PadR